jgi:hypothetical protein
LRQDAVKPLANMIEYLCKEPPQKYTGRIGPLDIRSELEHANYRPINKNELNDEMISDISKEFGFILVADVSNDQGEHERRVYVEALVKADVISQEQVEAVLEDENLAIVIPIHTERVATEMYRHIPHASHFVSIWVDGKPYEH